MYKPSYFSNKTMPTTEQAFTAKRKADARIKNCRELHAILEQLYEEDEDIFTYINIRRVGITSFTWVIKSIDNTRIDEAKLIEERLRPVTNRLLSYVWEEDLIGLLALKLEWKGFPAIPSIIFKYDASDLNWNTNPELIEYYNDNYKAQPVFASERENYILASVGNRPGGSLRRLINNRIIKSEMLKEWANFNVLVKGLTTLKIQDTSSEEDLAAGRNVLSQLMNRNYAIYGEDMQIDFKELVSSIGASSYKEIIEKLDAKCEKVILGQANATELPKYSGSRAAMEVLSKISADIILNDMLLAQELINDQLLKYYWIKNKGTGGACPFRFEFIWQEEEDPEKLAAVVDVLLRNNIPLRADEVYSKFNFAKPDEVGDVLKGAVNNGF